MRALLERAEIVSLHVPLSEATRNLIGAPELAMMRPGGILINVARGGLVDIEALHDALSGGHLAAAGLDDLPKEPPVPARRLIQACGGTLRGSPAASWSRHTPPFTRKPATSICGPSPPRSSSTTSATNACETMSIRAGASAPSSDRTERNGCMAAQIYDVAFRALEEAELAAWRRIPAAVASDCRTAPSR